MTIIVQGGADWRRHLGDHMGRLSDTSRRERFHGAISREAAVARILEIMPEAVLFARDDAGRVVGAAEVYLTREGAEIAVSIEDAHQGQGHGAAVFRRAVKLCRDRGLRRLDAICKPGNLAMIALCKSYGAVLTREDGSILAKIGLDALQPESASRCDVVETDETGDMVYSF